MFHSKARNLASIRQRINVAVLLAFVAQVLVPVGYMPAAIADGAYVQLCPTGLGPDVMALLHPQHAQASAAKTPSFSASGHEHEGHQGGGASSHSTEQHSVWSAQCPYGAFANSDLASQALRLYFPSVSAIAIAYATDIPQVSVRPVWSALQARAPPLLV